MGHGRLADIVIDCERPSRLARFWAATLDDYQVAAYDDEEFERLRSICIDDPMDDPTVLVESTSSVPRLWYQRVPEPERAKNRVHLDLRADDVGSELARLVSLGAVVGDDKPNPELIVLLDPEGNELCLLRP